MDPLERTFGEDESLVLKGSSGVQEKRITRIGRPFTIEKGNTGLLGQRYTRITLFGYQITMYYSKPRRQSCEG